LLRKLTPEYIPHQVTHHHLCSKRVLTMQYLPGPKLEGAMRAKMAALGINLDASEKMKDWLVRLIALDGH
jgi:aarF domain-containing kinase